MKILTRDDTEHGVEYVTRADAEREIESWKERARLTFDEECVCHFALRYALPRTSTASTIVSEFIRANMGRIDPRTLRQMAEEIEEAIRRGGAGHDIDVTLWRRLADDIYSANVKVSDRPS